MKKIILLTISILITFNGCDSKETKQRNHMNNTPFIVKCKNKNIPEFTLRYNSNPTQKQVEQLCICLWDNLVGWEKDTIIKITSGKEDEVDRMEMKAFPSRFGKRIEECGGDKL
ncbi:MAG: hypothetical protein ISR67_01200 [Sulfurimonas sp.]|nr:hypothetical protein [Sulfurimonas sp.]